MASTESTGDFSPQERVMVTADVVAAIREMKSDLKSELRSVKAEVVALREKAPSPKLLIGGALGAIMLVFGIQAATTVYLISGLLQTRGVDVSEAAAATKTVVAAGADAASVTTTTTTETVVPSAPEEQK